MSYEAELSLKQRADIASRKIYEAELLEGERAVIGSNGQTVFGDQELEMITHLNNTHISTIYAWLDTKVTDAWRVAYPDDYTEIATNALQRTGLHTRRDVFTLGRKRLSSGRRIGQIVLGRIEPILQNNYEITFKDEPSISDIGAYCRSLRNVTGLVLGNEIVTSMSVEDILSLNPYEIVEQRVSIYNIFSYEFKTGITIKKAEALLERAHQFKDSFDQTHGHIYSTG